MTAAFVQATKHHPVTALLCSADTNNQTIGSVCTQPGQDEPGSLVRAKRALIENPREP
jgi:hypothetical protein